MTASVLVDTDILIDASRKLATRQAGRARAPRSHCSTAIGKNDPRCLSLFDRAFQMERLAPVFCVSLSSIPFTLAGETALTIRFGRRISLDSYARRE